MQWSGGTFRNLTWNQSSKLKIEHVPNTCRGRVYRFRDIEIITEVQCYIVEMRSAEFIDLALEIFYFCICATNQAAQKYFGSLRNCINYCAKNPLRYLCEMKPHFALQMPRRSCFVLGARASKVGTIGVASAATKWSYARPSQRSKLKEFERHWGYNSMNPSALHDYTIQFGRFPM